MSQPVVQLTRADLRRRSDTYLVSHYVSLHVTVVSVVLAIAGIAAASLLAAQQSPAQDRALLSALWIASLLATTVAYAGTTSGSFALPASIPSMADLLIPLLIGVTEFLLFAVLVRQFTNLPSVQIVVPVWFFCMAAFGILAAIAIARARHVFRTAAFAPDIIADIEWYTNRLLRDIIGASTAAVVGLVGGMVHLLVADVSLVVAYGFLGIIIVMLATALRGHAATAKQWRDALTNPGIDANHRDYSTPLPKGTSKEALDSLADLE